MPTTYGLSRFAILPEMHIEVIFELFLANGVV